MASPTLEVPLTLEGSWTLHQMFRWREGWRGLSLDEQSRLIDSASTLLQDWQEPRSEGNPSQSAVYSILGHKGDLLFLHFRDSLDELHSAERQLISLSLFEFLEPVNSYVSVVELGLYESSAKTYRQLEEQAFEPHSQEWKAGIADVLTRQAAAMKTRLFPAIPAAKYLCFYPMDRKRGEGKNWYQVAMADRQRMMHEHGMVGRRYADSVRQIITGSIGFDDWEWGVDLFAEDPLIFKRLIYEMRFDEVSAVYALFGSFFIGERIPAGQMKAFLGQFSS